MKIIVIALLISLFTKYQLSHEQPVHQHIVRESWNLLRNSNPNYYNYIEMKQYVGNQHNSGPWDITNKERVVAGAWREDDEDVIWNYSCPTIPPFLFQYTNSHFWLCTNWNPENSNYLHYLSGYSCGQSWECGPVPGNAWNRLQKYINGGWILKKQYSGVPSQVTFNRWNGQGQFNVTSYGPIGLQYEGLVEGDRNLYHTGYMKVTHYSALGGGWIPYDPPVEVRITDYRKYFCYEILGRMAHCLADISVPAHVKLDPHPNECNQGDSYETKMGSEYIYYNSSNSGPIINPFVQNQYHPIYYLAFINNQIASNFPSNDVGRGYASTWTSYPFGIIADLLQGAPFWPYQSSNYFSSYGPSGITQERFDIIANYCMKSAIRTTAGLFYWFVQRTNQTVNYPPVISNITKNKPDDNFFWNENLIYTPIVSGTPPLNYNWEWRKCGSYLSGCQNAVPFPNGITINPGTTFTFSSEPQVYQTTPCTIIGNYPDCGTGNISYTLRLTVWNDYGTSSFQYMQNIIPRATFRPPPSGGGGCPYLYIWNSDSTLHITDNNVLHKSEFTDFMGQDITDKYKLQVPPNLNFGKYSIQIGENENDHDYFDLIKLYAVDHPIGTNIAITESNDIVMFDTTIVQGTDDANLNGRNITSNIQYYYQGKLLVTGIAGDNIYAHYDSTAQMRSAGIFKKKYNSILNSIYPDSMALIGEVDREPGGGGKSWGGQATIFFDPNNSIVKRFAMRENLSQIVIPFSGLGTAVDHVDINWTSPFSVTYFAVVPIAYSGFNLQEVPLNAAIHSINNDNVTAKLLGIDQDYAELDSSDYITIQFDSIPEPQSGWVRDFIIETHGRYTVGNSMAKPFNLTMLNENQNIYTFNLHTNYPNPFNPNTMIKYDIGKRSFVNLSIYNTLGQLIAVLVNENKQPGNYSVEFDGTNLPSGLYIYKIEASNYIDAKKMLLVK